MIIRWSSLSLHTFLVCLDEVVDYALLAYPVVEEPGKDDVDYC